MYELTGSKSINTRFKRSQQIDPIQKSQKVLERDVKGGTLQDFDRERERERAIRRRRERDGALRSLLANEQCRLTLPLKMSCIDESTLPTATLKSIPPRKLYKFIRAPCPKTFPGLGFSCRERKRKFECYNYPRVKQ